MGSLGFPGLFLPCTFSRGSVAPSGFMGFGFPGVLSILCDLKWSSLAVLGDFCDMLVVVVVNALQCEHRSNESVKTLA